jgi:hypothetical protein
MFLISSMAVMSITVPVLDEAQSVALLLAPAGLNGGKYFDPGTNTSRIASARVGLIIVGWDNFGARNRPRCQRFAGFADMSGSRIERDEDRFQATRPAGPQEKGLPGECHD